MLKFFTQPIIPRLFDLTDVTSINAKDIAIIAIAEITHVVIAKGNEYQVFANIELDFKNIPDPIQLPETNIKLYQISTVT